MGRVGTEFFKDEHYEELVANATLAVRTKMDAAINWYEANTWEEALEVSQAKCNESDIDYGLRPENRFNGGFVSENNAMKAIARIADLSLEEEQQFINEFYTKGAFSQELKDKIASAFRENPEEKVIKVLRAVHVSWNIDQHNKFEMWNDKKGKARNSEHQFDDLLLMQYGEDGATADKIFIDTMFDSLGITINEDRLKELFIEEQKEFTNDIMMRFGNGSKNFHQALVAYLKSGEYISYCEKVAGKELTTTATAIKNDPNRSSTPERWANSDEVRILELVEQDDKVVEGMANLIEAQLRANGLDFSDHIPDDTEAR